MTPGPRSSWRAALTVCLAIVFAGCASAPPPRSLSEADVNLVVGKWSGPADYVAPGSSISKPTHRFTFTADGKFSEMMGTWISSGTFRIADGKVLFEGPNSKGALALYESDGQRTLEGSGQVLVGAWMSLTGSGPGRYRLELRPDQ